MPNGDEVQFQSPTTGAIQAVPSEHWDEALNSGYKPTSHKVMYSPSGERGMVANEELAAHMKQGYRVTPETQFEKERKGLTNDMQEADYRRAYDKEGERGGLVLTDSDVATAGLGGMGIGKSIARQGIKVAARGVAKSALGAAGGSFAGSHGGRALGSIVGHPDEGAQIGATVGGLAGGLFSGMGHEQAPFETPGNPGEASLPSTDEFYAKRGAELNSMRKLQPGAFKSEPWDVPTQDGSVGAPLPSADEFYERRGSDLMARGKAQATLDRQAGGESVGSKILAPSAGEPRVSGSEGRPATWTNERVMELAKQGNRDAIAQATRRGMELPPNSRYVMGDPDYPRAVYNPKEVTRSAPDNMPIRNAANPTAKTPLVGIQVPPTESAPKEIINAATGEVRNPQAESMGTPMPPAAEPVGLKPGGLLSDIPQAAPNPRELEDLSQQLGRPITAAEYPELRRRLDAERNISEGLRGNRKDTAGEVREKHREKLEKKGKR